MSATTINIAPCNVECDSNRYIDYLLSDDDRKGLEPKNNPLNYGS